MDDLRVMFVLFYKDEMIDKGIIPKDIKWDMLTKEQKDKIKEFIEKKLENYKNKENIND